MSDSHMTAAQETGKFGFCNSCEETGGFDLLLNNESEFVLLVTNI